GGTGFLSGAGLGGQLSRVDRGASVWALVDVSRYPKVQQGFSRGGNAHGGSDAGQALFGAMKSVTFFSFQATVRSDDLALVATGVSPDAETRQLLEDSLKGVVAMWRLAVQEKQPDLVTVLRRFKIDSTGDAVTVSGTLPGSVVRSLAEKRSAAKQVRSQAHTSLPPAGERQGEGGYFQGEIVMISAGTPDSVTRSPGRRPSSPSAYSDW
ncbi:MAG TPA: hypothetical protein VIZ58_08570, partial [Thermoanaerobaculia bacterium]